ncbi:uncharacterized protein LOC141658767 [Silene latifolia]|uniref:uncharacterized protein LOC141658767 n=1 Tax=Silene latifolia TaxID=37657 RepID=UPI003D77F434
MRETVLQIAGERLRGWRTYMTSYFVFKTRKQRRKVPINDPSTIYDGITKEDWALFVRQRMDEKFQEKSKKVRESQKNNLHPHYMGRTGYAGKLPQWHKEEVEAILSSNPAADPVTTQQSVAKRLEDRGYAWIKGHTPSLKNPPKPTQKLIEEIKHWKKMEEKGKFVPTRKEDVLVKALGKPEHCGRTRGVGSRVGIQSYFGKPTSRRRLHETLYTENDLMMFKEEVKKETMTQMNEIVNQKVSEIYKKLKMTLPPELEEATHLDQLEETTHLDQSSVRSIEPKDPFLELKSPVPCRLAVYGIDSEIIVADGTAWPWKEGTMVHNTPLSHQNVRVSIDNILDGKSQLPIPWDENVRVAEVFGSFAQWPKSLVLLENKEDNNSNEKLKDHAKSKDPKECDNDFQHGDDNVVHLNKDEDKSMEKVNSNGTKTSSTTVQHGNEETFEKKGPLSVKELSELGQHCQRLERNICSAILGEHSLFNIKISKLVYAYEQDIEQLMLFEDIREMFRYYCLNITMLQVWGSFLYEYATQSKVKLPVGFLCPDKLCTYTRAPLDMEEYVTNALKKQEKNRYIMGAFREGYHWMLLVFDIGENILYIFDSAQTPRKNYLIKTNLKEAWKPYCFMAGRRHPYKKNDLQVKMIDCPQQPNNYE